MKIKNALLIFSLFAAIRALAVEPELSVFPFDGMLQVAVNGNTKASSPNVEYAKVGNIETAKICDKWLGTTPPPPGLNNITLCGTLKISGQNGIVRIISYGAGNLITPGYRLSAEVVDGEYKLRLLMVGNAGVERPDNVNNYCIIFSKKHISCGEWIFFSVVMNRAENAEIFVNGEPVGSGPIKALKDDDLSKPDLTILSDLEVAGDISMEFAKIEAYYSLFSSVELEALNEKGLEILKAK